MAFPLPEPMAHALRLATAAGRAGAVPIAAVIVKNGNIIAAGVNAAPGGHDPTAHAEIIAIRSAAAALGQDKLEGCDIWVTLEPCAMCAGAIIHARLARLYYGADDPKGGAVEHGARLFAQPNCNHRPEIYGGIGAKQAGALLRKFFADRRT